MSEERSIDTPYGFVTQEMINDGVVCCLCGKSMGMPRNELAYCDDCRTMGCATAFIEIIPTNNIN